MTPKTVDNNLQLEEALIIRVNIKGKKVFLNNMYRTGVLQKDAKYFHWQEMESTSDEIMDSFSSDLG